MNRVKLSDYEQNIEKNLSGYKPVSSKERERVEQIIHKAREKKNICLRLNRQDINMLKMRAEKEGMPYQTLISSVLHKFVTEQFVDQKMLAESIKHLKINR